MRALVLKFGGELLEDPARLATVVAADQEDDQLDVGREQLREPVPGDVVHGHLFANDAPRHVDVPVVALKTPQG